MRRPLAIMHVMVFPFLSIHCRVPPFCEIAKLVQIQLQCRYSLCYANSYSIHGVYKPADMTGGAPHCGKIENKCWDRQGFY